ncbi:RNA-directed DNA polymerase [Pedobacter agri]|uniref:RNA-directed DNA polymerase n=1 Tax=Pedobacter agri TaxID=454586 RepID=UPI00292F3518|nr:RNA-directed DNA polymerase [Pedobacter agri]
MNFILNDLVIAYKKAKSELFHEKLQVAGLELPDYEANLYNNLNNLLIKLNSGKFDFVESDGFNPTPNFYPIVKRLYLNAKTVDESSIVYYSSIKSRWDNRFFSIEKADFRVISNLSIDFHILSSLWIDKVAYAFEQALSPSSYGSRLNKISENATTHGLHFKPYIQGYRKWQKNGLDIIRENLERNDETIALTADIKSFYHHINCSFLLSEDFFKSFAIGRNLSKEQVYLNKLIVKAIQFWSKSVFNSLSEITREPFAEQKHIGIPIGLAASKVIANLVLKEFDDAVEQELMPLYYGRYVDDIFIVSQKTKKINKRTDLWLYISKHIERLYFDTSSSESTFKLLLSKETQIAFNNEKERIFFLDKECGVAIVNEIEKELNENSSEWRLLPDAKEDLEKFSDEVIKASSDSTEAPNSLRKSDGISIQRLKYALFLRNAEEMILTHPYGYWKKGVDELFRATANFVVDPEIMHNYLPYLVKILRIAIFNGDLVNTKRIWESILLAFDSISWGIFLSETEEVPKYKEYLLKNIEFAFYSGWSINKSEGKTKSFLEGFQKLTHIKLDTNRVERFLLADFHLVPLKNIFDPKWLTLKKKVLMLMEKPEMKPYLVDLRLEEGILNEDLISSKIPDLIRVIYLEFLHPSADPVVPLSFFFLTRKMNYLEITALLSQWLTEQKELFRAFLKVFELHDFEVELIEEDGFKRINANLFPAKSDPLVALTSYQISDASWKAHVIGTREPDLTRYKRLYELVNSILLTKDRKVDYIVLPELALSQAAVNAISKKIKGSGITLITGIEYDIDRTDGTARNRIAIVLPITVDGRTELVQIIQEKIIPAIHEAKELNDSAGLRLVAYNKDKYIISKNGFTFSSLICNEFLNIDYRSGLRGKIDGLFLAEWNQDIETYNSLVESAASDLHAFIVQVNNRLYGDTRVRAAFKKAHERDVARIRGGLLDYFVICALKVKDLRNFQMNVVSPAEPFKPVPTGFVMDPKRRLK